MTKKPILNNILIGLSNGICLRAGKGQGYQNYNCLNKPGEKVGEGIYSSPKLSVAMGYSNGIDVNGVKYHLVFQCRINPAALKECTKDGIWVVNDALDIRPYAILLIKSGDVGKIR